MKAIYKYIPFAIVGLICLNIQAQQRKDSVINRQVLIEREYAPTLKDASKVNVTPSIYEPEIKIKESKLITDAPQIDLSINQLGSIPPGDLDSGIEFDKKKGYFTFGAGTHSNLDGAAGYQILNDTKNKLDIFGYHSSTNGNVDYLLEEYEKKSSKAKYANSKLNLNYKRKFAKADLFLHTGYNSQSFNYYGNCFNNTPTKYDYSTNQNVSIINFGLGLDGKVDPDAVLNYKGAMSFDSYTTKCAIATDEKGPKGSIFKMNVDLFKDLGFDKRAGANISILNQSSNLQIRHFIGAFTDYTNVTIAPYFKIEGFSWNLNLGVNAHIIGDFTENFAVTPNIKFDIKTGEKDMFYINFLGDVNNNTVLDILQENRYVNLLNKVEYSTTAFDAKTGYRTGSKDGFEFDFFVGFKSVKKDHLFIYENVWARMPLDANTSHEKTSWSNTSHPIYADMTTGQVGTMVKTSLIPYTYLSGKVTAYFNNVKYVEPMIKTHKPLSETIPAKAWGKPSFTVDLNAVVKPIDNFTFTVDYSLVGGRKTYFNSNNGPEIINMKVINELNVKGEYQFRNWVSFFARANNLLFQKYELQYGYPLQGFNLMAGVDFKF